MTTWAFSLQIYRANNNIKYQMLKAGRRFEEVFSFL